MFSQRFLTIFRIFILIICFTFNISSSLYSQIKSKSVISGRIIDAETGKPIPNVNLFLAYTTIGSITGKDGKFIIENIPIGQYDLIVSHIGYELTTFQIMLVKKGILTHDFQLKPKILKGEKVEVEAPTAEEWKKNLKIFTQLFIGKTKNSKDCKILNPEVINFEVDQETEVFTAYTDSVIYVSNQSLGYKINMILDFCILNPKAEILKYQVYPKFELMKHQKEKELKKWKKNRQETYEGSFRHFISALAQGKLEEEKFQLYIHKDKRKKIIKNYKKVYLSPDTLGLQKFHFDDYLYCLYMKNKLSIFELLPKYRSWLELLTDYVQIDSLGNCYDELEIIKRGFWGKARMADVLPFDYEPSKN